MHLLILGQGKTGSLITEIARARKHEVRVLTSADNPNAEALTTDNLRGVDAVIDFTNPTAVIPNIEACIRARCNMVVGTTGWYHNLPRIQKMVESTGTALLYGANFSVGV